MKGCNKTHNTYTCKKCNVDITKIKLQQFINDLKEKLGVQDESELVKRLPLFF